MSNTWLDVGGDEGGDGGGVVEHCDWNVCLESYCQLRTHLGRLHEGSFVYNTALMGTYR